MYQAHTGWIPWPSCAVKNDTRTLEGILADAASRRPIPLVTIIIYDLPNRDCHAKASNGEICCVPNPDGTCDYDSAGDGTCSTGLETYKSQYVDVLASVLAEYPQVPVVGIVEPDSLPNLATNMADPHCGNQATVTAYKEGIPYAVQTIAQASPNVTLYLDAAHGGWMGWANNMQDYITLVQGLNVAQYIRGWSTNVANYQPVGQPCPTWDWCLPNNGHQSDPCCYDPCDLSSQYNGAVNEHQYAQTIIHFAQQAGLNDPHVVIDTGRAGVANMRQNCANWCNIRGSGAGVIPTTNTSDSTGAIDAYYWLKTPGESDGCTATLPSGGQCSRYDSFCGSTDSIGSEAGEPYAPVAGSWFDYMVKMLATNAALDG